MFKIITGLNTKWYQGLPTFNMKKPAQKINSNTFTDTKRYILPRWIAEFCQSKFGEVKKAQVGDAANSWSDTTNRKCYHDLMPRRHLPIYEDGKENLLQANWVSERVKLTTLWRGVLCKGLFSYGSLCSSLVLSFFGSSFGLAGVWTILHANQSLTFSSIMSGSTELKILS